VSHAFGPHIAKWHLTPDGVLSAVWSIEEPVFDPVGRIAVGQAALTVLGAKFGD